jgi:hypothetical protein
MSLYQKTLFGLGLFAYVVLLIIQGETVTIGIFKPAPMVLSLLVAAAFIFDKWLLSCHSLYPFLHPWYVPYPNMNGTFEGTIESTWIDPATGATNPLINTYIVVRQTLSAIHVRLYTEESKSISLASSFVKSDDGRQELMFTYRNEPNQKKRPQSPIHYGGTRLQISPDHKQLEGTYWTDRKTTGDIKFTRISRNNNSHSYEACTKLSN